MLVRSTRLKPVLTGTLVTPAALELNGCLAVDVLLDRRFCLHAPCVGCAPANSATGDEKRHSRALGWTIHREGLAVRVLDLHSFQIACVCRASKGGRGGD